MGAWFACLFLLAGEASAALTFAEAQKNGANGVSGLGGANAVAVSPDAKTVYVAGFNEDAVVVFVRNSQGKLDFVQALKNNTEGVTALDGPYALKVSPDGKHVYVAAYAANAVLVFSRNASTGALAHVQTVQDNGNLAGASGVAVSGDGALVYVTGASSGSVAAFSRDAGTGSLTYRNKYASIPGANGVAVVGKHVYVSATLDNSVVALDDSAGQLGLIGRYANGTQGISGLGAAYAVSLSPDGKWLYAVGNTSNSLVVFTRDAGSGALSFLARYQDGVDGVDGLSGVRGVTASPDGKTVYAAGMNENALAVFATTPSGALTFVQALKNGSGGIDGLVGASSVAASAEQVYVSGFVGASLAVFGTVAADLGIKVAVQQMAALNTPFTYKITASNLGPDNILNAVVTDTLPTGVTFVSATPSQGSCQESGGVVVCGLGQLAAGGSATLALTVTPLALGPVVNQARIGGSPLDLVAANNTVQSTTEIRETVPTADLQLSLGDSSDPASTGSVLTYTVGVTNAGPDPATQVTITHTAPEGVAILANVPTQGSCSRAGNVVTCVVDELPAQSSVSVKVDVRVPDAPTVLQSSASVISQAIDPVEANDSASQTTQTAVISGDVEVSALTASHETVPLGENLTYRVTVGNLGAAPVDNVVLKNTLPSGVWFVSAVPSQGVPDPAHACQPAGGVVNCSLGTLDAFATAGSSATVSITVTPVTSGTLSNIAEVTANATDADLTNNRRTLDVTASGDTVDIAVTLSATPATPGVGATLEYLATVTNNGAAAAKGVGLSDVLPADVKYLGNLPSQGSCGETSGTVSCTLGDIDAGASATVKISVVPTKATAISNTVKVSSLSFDPVQANNQATLDMLVTPASADLRVKLTAPTDPVRVDDKIEVLATVGNLGPNTALARLEVTLPEGVAFISGTPTQGGPCTEDSPGGVVCILGDLQANVEATVTLALMPQLSGLSAIAAQVVAEVQDLNPDNNSATADLLAQELPQLSYVTAYVDGIDGVTGLKGANSLDLSPDGKHLYATAFHGDAVAAFSRDAATGQLTFMEALTNGVNGVSGLGKASSIQVGGSGLAAYVTGFKDNALTVLNRDTATGKLTPGQVILGQGMYSPYHLIKVGNFIYVANVNGDTLMVFRLNAATGRWEVLHTYRNGSEGVTGLDGVVALALSPDAKYLYSASVDGNALTVFRRDPATGLLNFLQRLKQGVDPNVDGLKGAMAVAVSPDGNDVYAGGYLSNGMAHFRRQADGTLKFVESFTGLKGLGGVSGLLVSPDGMAVYSAGANDNAVGVFARDPLTGKLRYRFPLEQGVGGVNGLRGVQKVAISPDQLYLYAASLMDGAISVFRFANADVSVKLAADQDPVLVGENLTYTVTLENNGPDPATGVTLNSTLPASVTLVSSTSSNGPACGLAGQKLSCYLGLLESGKSATVEIVVTPTAETVLTHTVSVGSRQVDPVAANNTASLATRAVASADLQLTLQDKPDPTAVSSTLTYVLAVKNAGPSLAQQVVLQAALPSSGISVLAIEPAQGQCTRTASLVTCQLGQLAPQAQASVNIRVKTTQQGSLSAQAQVQSAQLDPHPEDNAAAATTTVVSNVISTLYDNTDKVLENHIITATGVVFGGALGGSMVNQGLVRDVAVLPGAVLSGGGRLAGNIVNQGVIDGAHLDAGVYLSGGKLRGTISGTPSSPAIIGAAYVEAGTRLSYVILDSIAQISPDSVLGAGVRFASSRTIPPGLVLSGALGLLHEPITDAYSANLAGDVLLSGGNLLADINAIPLLRDQGLSVTQLSYGYLTARVGAESVALVPWTVTQAASGPLSSVELNPDGSVLFRTAQGREILAQPAAQSPETLRAALNAAGMGLPLKARPNGNLNLPLGGGEYLATRPGVSALPAGAGILPGGILLRPTWVAGMNIGVLGFRDSQNLVREQVYYPAPAYPQALRKALENSAGISNVVIGMDGLISVLFGGKVHYGQFDYLVKAGAPPAGGQLTFQGTADQNGDGIGDFLVIYPPGERQFMFYLPTP